MVVVEVHPQVGGATFRPGEEFAGCIRLITSTVNMKPLLSMTTTTLIE